MYSRADARPAGLPGTWRRLTRWADVRRVELDVRRTFYPSGGLRSERWRARETATNAVVTTLAVLAAVPLLALWLLVAVVRAAVGVVLVVVGLGLGLLAVRVAYAVGGWPAAVGVAAGLPLWVAVQGLAGEA